MQPSVEESVNTRTRKSPQQREEEILRATVKLISQRGYNGISLRDVASEVGMTQQGVLHYVGNKAGLAAMVMKEFYDPTSMPGDFLASGLPGSDRDAPHFPAYLRYVVRENAKRRDLVQMFAILQAESIDPDHPAHDYFEHRPAIIWQTLRSALGRTSSHCTAWPSKQWTASNCDGCVPTRLTCTTNGSPSNAYCSPRPFGTTTGKYRSGHAAYAYHHTTWLDPYRTLLISMMKSDANAANPMATGKTTV